MNPFRAIAPLILVAGAMGAACAAAPAGAAPPRTVRLDRLDISSVSAEWGTPRANRSIDGNPLRIGGRTFPRGIGTHAFSRMVVDLGGGAGRFRASVGLDDEMRGSVGTVVFTVSGAGRTLWTSGVMRPGDRAKEVDVDLSGIPVLILEVTDAGDGIGSDHGDWADARIETAGPSPAAVHWEADAAVESLGLFRRLQDREPVLARQEAFDRVRAIERMYARLPAGNSRLRALLDGIAPPSNLSRVPWDRPLDRLALTWANHLAMRKPAPEMRKLPAADVFPGPVDPGLPRIADTVTVDLAVPHWHSTGLYAPPGEPVTVTIPEKLARLGLAVQVGGNTDELWHLDELLRAPEITNTHPLTRVRTVVANPFGGLVSIVVPARGGAPEGVVPEQFGWDVRPIVRVPTPARIRISGAVRAPRYVLGETPVDEWREGFRYLPVPMAELVGKRVVFQLPSDQVRTLDRPDEVLRFWDEVMLHQDWLAGWPPQTVPMYFTLDRQISAGGGHSGYPIMAYADWGGEIVNVAMTRSKGGWGTYHELGHNHQWSEGWYFQDQVEVTVNLFSLYCNARMSGWKVGLNDYPPTDDWLRVTSREFHRRVLRRVWSRDPAVPGKWKDAGVDEKLAFHVELIEAFGWDALRKVIVSYHENPEFPGDDEGRGGEFMVRWSRAAGRNLFPFFHGWGVGMPKGIEGKVADLPPWLPDVLKEI